ncbi:hypothetical protein AVEN_126040-1 [Araneus ventricosus]|uniref:Uncharacterized protein n=1 Tax=Araneus ventricosus TaxID=182803 RepID=A0A4Y2WQJ0_ARAVE|nr:hypothetical protein AVEN_126040-1 [Araneus ventricosus]
MSSRWCGGEALRGEVPYQVSKFDTSLHFLRSDTISNVNDISLSVFKLSCLRSDGLMVRFRDRRVTGFKPDFTAVYVGLVHVKSDVEGQTKVT